MNKNLLRVVALSGYILVVVGLMQLVNQIIPIQPHEFFTAIGIIRTVIYVLLVCLGGYAFQLILLKYGAQIITPKEKKITTIILVVGFVLMLAILFVSFMNK